MVKNSAFWFSYDSAFRIRPNGPVRKKIVGRIKPWLDISAGACCTEKDIRNGPLRFVNRLDIHLDVLNESGTLDQIRTTE